MTGSLEPTSGRVKRGKTVKVATLTQRLDELDQHLNDPVRVVISNLRTTYAFGNRIEGAGTDPRAAAGASRLLERPALDTGQRPLGRAERRLQLLLVILDQPNVLILDEPTNDLDTDMLAAMEDLLDSWSGTLIVVSHDRYFLERVTDQQYAILDTKLRPPPRGVDEYLRLRALQDAEPSRPAASGAPTAPAGLQGADLRAAQKEASAAERKIEKLQQQIERAKAALADHDQADYVGLGKEMERIGDGGRARRARRALVRTDRGDRLTPPRGRRRRDPGPRAVAAGGQWIAYSRMAMNTPRHAVANAPSNRTGRRAPRRGTRCSRAGRGR